MVFVVNSEHGSQSLFGRRRGRKLRSHRQNLMDELLPRLSLGVGESVVPFGNYKKYILEIGFGAGEHLAELALRDSDIGFVGCEVYVNGVASLLSRIDSDGLENVRIFTEDARLLFPLISDGFFSEVYMLFPDPWHKVRHAKRRLLQESSVGEFARILCDGGVLHVASDNDLYVRHVLGCLSLSDYFNWDVDCPDDWRFAGEGHVRTRYEEKALAAGRNPVYLKFKKLVKKIKKPCVSTKHEVL